MLIIDHITIIMSVVLLALALLASFINPFFRRTRPKKKDTAGKSQAAFTEETANDGVILQDPTTEKTQPLHATKSAGEEKSLPPISIILTPDDDAEALSDNLSLYLEQDYPTDYQVIVVAPKKDKETEDILKQHANKRLYITFTPDSSRYMSKKKLAITLGVKASKYNWVLMADIFCKPQNDQWLKAMAMNIGEGDDLIIGNTLYDQETPHFRVFERFHKTLYLLREYYQNRAYRCETNALLFRKDMFLTEEGFRGNLKFIRGEYDFMVNKYAGKYAVRHADTPEATLIEPAPTEKMWRNKHLYYMESRKHLERSFRHRLLFNIDQCLLHLNYMAIIGASIFAGLTSRWLILGAAALSLIMTVCLKIHFFSKKQKEHGLEIPLSKALLFEIGIVWHNLKFMIAYKKADKYNFISHKL